MTPLLNPHYRQAMNMSPEQPIQTSRAELPDRQYPCTFSATTLDIGGSGLIDWE